MTVTVTSEFHNLYLTVFIQIVRYKDYFRQLADKPSVGDKLISEDRAKPSEVKLKVRLATRPSE
jgi:hypothetical protein